MSESRQYPDIAAVRHQARRDWEREFKHRLSVQERIGESVSWWLVLVAAVFFLLSVPHTMTIFAMITPWVGWVAPLGIEFGLLYVAFSRKQVQKSTWFLRFFFSLLFITSIVANGAGSLFAVLDTMQELESLSLSAIVEAFGTMPAQNQVALFLVPVAALIIPIGTVVAGEGLAALFLERRASGSQLEDAWLEARSQVEFEALRDAMVQLGHTPVRSAQWARGLTATLESSPKMSGASALSAIPTDGQDTLRTYRTDTADNDTERGHNTGQGYTKRMDARTLAAQYLSEHPDAASMPVRMFAGEVGISKTTAAEVLRTWGHNGHGNHNGHTHTLGAVGAGPDEEA